MMILIILIILILVITTNIDIDINISINIDINANDTTTNTNTMKSTLLGAAEGPGGGRESASLPWTAACPATLDQSQVGTGSAGA